MWINSWTCSTTISSEADPSILASARDPDEPSQLGAGSPAFGEKGKPPVLAADEALELLDAIDTISLDGLRDRTLIGLMVYTFARVGAVIKMRVEDVYVQSRRTWVRRHEKAGKRNEMPCHHNLDEYLHAYMGATQRSEGGVVQISNRPNRTAH